MPPAAVPVVAAVVFLHGSGDTGPGLRRGLAGLERGLASRGVAIHFPSAVPIPYRLADNQVMSVWYDRFALEPSAPEHTDSVLASAARLHALLDSIVAAGVPPHRIALGGFSQGGGMALQAALRWRSCGAAGAVTGAGAGTGSCASDSCARTGRGVGAIFALSSYLCDNAPLLAELPAAQTKDVMPLPPVYFRHGDQDDFILGEWGETTAQRLRAKGVAVDFDFVRGAGHELTLDELDELSQWLLERIGVSTPGGGADVVASSK